MHTGERVSRGEGKMTMDLAVVCVWAWQMAAIARQPCDAAEPGARAGHELSLGIGRNGNTN